MISEGVRPAPHLSPATERDRAGISDVPAPTDTLTLPPLVTVPAERSEATEGEHHPEVWYG
jgi:hypothetical protein